MTSRTGNRGFTLIEVLVASVILFAGLGVILKAYSMAVVALGAAEDTLASSDLLAEQAAEIELKLGAGTDPGSLPGSVTRDGVAYVYDIHSTQTPVTPLLTAVQADIQITRLRGATPHRLACEWAIFKEPERVP